MRETTYIAVERTMDPLQIIINCLFEKNGEVAISDQILEIIKKSHSFTMKPNGEEAIYTFNRRARGTDTFFSFLITTGTNGNRVSDLEYTSELGKREKISDPDDFKIGIKIYVLLKEEMNS